MRISDWSSDVCSSDLPEIEFVKAGYLNDHPAVLDAFAERVQEIRDGENLMNCKLCKYRAQVLVFEAEVGLAQESHHHHVERIGTGKAGHHLDHDGQGHDHPHHDLSHDHAHGHDQQPGHHH